MHAAASRAPDKTDGAEPNRKTCLRQMALRAGEHRSSGQTGPSPSRKHLAALIAALAAPLRSERRNALVAKPQERRVSPQWHRSAIGCPAGNRCVVFRPRPHANAHPQLHTPAVAALSDATSDARLPSTDVLPGCTGAAAPPSARARVHSLAHVPLRRLRRLPAAPHPRQRRSATEHSIA